MNEILERFPVVGTVTIKSAEGDTDLPILGIKMMSDERGQELAIENSVHNYIREHGRAPESIEQALEWQRNRVNRLQAI